MTTPAGVYVRWSIALYTCLAVSRIWVSCSAAMAAHRPHARAAIQILRGASQQHNQQKPKRHVAWRGLHAKCAARHARFGDGGGGFLAGSGGGAALGGTGGAGRAAVRSKPTSSSTGRSDAGRTNRCGGGSRSSTLATAGGSARPPAPGSIAVAMDPTPERQPPRQPTTPRCVHKDSVWAAHGPGERARCANPPGGAAGGRRSVGAAGSGL